MYERLAVKCKETQPCTSKGSDEEDEVNKDVNNTGFKMLCKY